MSIRITNGALDETKDGAIVLRGAIDPPCLSRLRAPAYQREVVPQSTIEKLSAGLKDGRAPDVELAQRSGSYESTKEEPNVFVLPGPVYIVDGLQRVTAAIKVLAEGNMPLIGALVHFSTTEKWERERFRILNQERTRVSPNILLRNATNDYPILRMLEELTHDHSFAMADRVSWSQRMQRSTLITALVYCQTVLYLHSAVGGLKTSGVFGTCQALQALALKVDRNIVRENVKAFFHLIDECWDIKQVVYRERATHLRGAFLLTLASVLADHENFWRDRRLVIPRDLQRKLAAFPIRDPQVIAFASSRGRGARLLLYPAIVTHLNSGRRNHKLIKGRNSGMGFAGTRHESK